MTLIAKYRVVKEIVTLARGGKSEGFDVAWWLLFGSKSELLFRPLNRAITWLEKFQCLLTRRLPALNCNWSGNRYFS